MSSFLDRVLDLEHLSAAGEGVRFAFERSLPPYVWVGIAGACVGAGVYAYWRHSGNRSLRWVLAGARAALLLVLAVLLAGPMLERKTESSESDWVLVLIDRSRSMSVADASDETGARTTRDEQLRAAIEAARPGFEQLANGRELRWFGVGEGAYELPLDDSGMPILGDAGARRTRLGRGIGDALQRAAARPLAGMVVISDGRSLDTVARASLRDFSSAGAPIHTVLLGATGAVSDVAVRRVAAPRVAYQNDPAPVTVELSALGETDGLRGRIDLIDERTGEVLESQDVTLEGGASEHTLAHRPEHAGDQRWRVEFVPDEPDLVTDNNSASLALEIVDRPVRVLYLDGYPRWEQRYLRNLLVREATVESANLMLAAGRRYLQEGDVEISTLPASPEEWAEYDVVVLGDVAPGVLTPAQIEQVRLFVADEGGGLVWIGGESDTPRSWWSTPLAALLPFSPPASTLGALRAPAQAFPTPEADRLGVLRLTDESDAAWPEELSDPSVAWSALHWVQDIAPASLKPTATTLASAAPINGGAPSPLVVTMRYGAGRVVYIATDEIWRWRYGRGEILYERFWVQLVRLLGRERLVRGGGGFRLRAASETVSVGEPLPLTLDIVDQSLLESAPDTIRVRFAQQSDSLDSAAPGELTLVAVPGDAGRYTGVWTPASAGAWSVEVVDPLLRGASDGVGRVGVSVTLPGGELADPRPDHEHLRTLASQTGGQAMTPGELSSIGDPGVFPSRRVRRVSVERETLWDTPLALAIIIVLATFEWIGRRILRVM